MHNFHKTPRLKSASRSAKSSPGFTLIELLVVISIIAILMTMLMVAITLVKRGALATNCTSNLHQISMASMAYSGENDGYQVPNYGTNPDGTNNPRYFDFLYPYIGMNSGLDSKQKKNVFVCPAGRPMKISAEGGWDWLWNYGVNEALHPNFDVGTNWKSISNATIKRPSETADFADVTQPTSDVSGNSSLVFSVWNSWATDTGFYDDDGGFQAILSSADPDNANGLLRYRHGGKGYGGQACNIAWCDGHVSPVKHQVLVKSKNFAAEMR